MYTIKIIKPETDNRDYKKEFFDHVNTVIPLGPRFCDQFDSRFDVIALQYATRTGISTYTDTIYQNDTIDSPYEICITFDATICQTDSLINQLITLRSK